MNDQIFNLKIISPSEVLFEGQVVSISSRNTKGNFDILGKHANFITLITKKTIYIRKTDGAQQSFNFTQAILYLINNNVTIFAEPQASLNSTSFTI